MLPMESDQLFQDVAARAQARMVKDLPARDHVVGDAAEAYGDFDMRVARVFAKHAPLVGQGAEVIVALDQVVGDEEDGGAESAVAAAHQGAVGMIDAITLVS